MSFVADSQEHLQSLNVVAGNRYKIEYQNKDYYNGEETIEQAEATAVIAEGKIYFNVVDPYGMDKMVMKVRILS
jgi:hypothetical protein